MNGHKEGESPAGNCWRGLDNGDFYIWIGDHPPTAPDKPGQRGMPHGHDHNVTIRRALRDDTPKYAYCGPKSLYVPLYAIDNDTLKVLLYAYLAYCSRLSVR